MKTMLLLKKLSNLFLFFTILSSVQVHALETKWEVAVLFLGQNEDETFQKDVEKNLRELSKIPASDALKLGVYQENNEGHFIGQKKTSKDFPAFLKSFFSKSSSAKKALVIYSHGKGADGLKDYSTPELKSYLTELPHLNLLWMDSCFMANTEFLYELRSVSDYTLASEEAEFASGLPFQVIRDLPKMEDSKAAGIFLAQQFIESYSFLKKGSQRNYVSVSSATIAMVENKKLETLAFQLKKVAALIKKLPAAEKGNFLQRLKAKAAMDDKNFVDLGMLLVELRKATSASDKELTAFIRMLNIESVKKLRSNPRIRIEVPSNATRFVFGFNNWKDGSKKDFLENDMFSALIKNDGFTADKNGTEWPYKNLKSDSIILSPFAPGLNSFDYLFMKADGSLLSTPVSVTRTHDFVESYADTAESPLIYSAYTQRLGTKAERYTGLNISLPGSVPSIDYVDLEFNKLAQWLSL